MDKHLITILPEGITVQVAGGTNLLQAAKEAGIDIAGACGGHGTCGKCAVKVVRGKYPAPRDDSRLPQDLRDSGYVLACRVEVNGDMAVEVPHFSRLAGQKVVLSGKTTSFIKEHEYFAKTKINPICRKYYLKLNKPDLSDNINDLDRLKTALFKTCGIDKLNIGFDCLRLLPEVLREGNWEVTVTIANIKGMNEIVRVEPGKPGKPAFGLAVDIGTTTVAVSLLDTEKGEIIGEAGAYNRQAVYGSDVISRIIYTDENKGGTDVLQKAVVKTINELTGELLDKNGLTGNDIPVAVCGGNTVMIHMFMGMTASFLRLEPYTPGAVNFPAVRAKELGLKINPDARVITVPSVASYVGGDITSGVLATMITHSDKLSLFIDIGTNGELALGGRDWLVTCSCSAGPAFEGSGISCGMRAMDGAIDWIEIDENNLEVKCRAIGGIKPKGICGSGLIQSLSRMKKAGVIDRAGKILESTDSPRVRIGNEGMEYVLVYARDSGNGRDIFITEADIKNLLRAKGAIFAGIRTMLQQVQLDINDIDRVYIAGGFGAYVNIAGAVRIGLLPDLPADKFEYVGNSCIQGGMIMLLCREALMEAEEIADNMTYFELSVGNEFMDEFVSALFIPHTDLSLFPTVEKNPG